jgi:hypothetical protein
VRGKRFERDRLQDNEIMRARMWYESLSRDARQLSPLPSEPDHQYVVPPVSQCGWPVAGFPLTKSRTFLRDRLVHWQSIKLLDETEEEEDGATIIREEERFSNVLTLVFCTGEIASLK